MKRNISVIAVPFIYSYLLKKHVLGIYWLLQMSINIAYSFWNIINPPMEKVSQFHAQIKFNYINSAQ